MTRRKGLVLDANILLRAVFGVRVRALLETYEEEVSFYSPDVCFDDARKYIPEIAKRRRIDPECDNSESLSARVVYSILPLRLLSSEVSRTIMHSFLLDFP
jgi:hypothetical protein